jgi:shikimate kinase
MSFIKENGFSVFLNMPFDELICRLTMIRKRRPLLKGVREDELEDFVRNQLKEREPFYNRADLILEGPDYDLKEIIAHLNK